MLSNNTVILLAICFLPSEFASHVAWMLLNLAKAGLDLSEYPVQTDRGNITDAVRWIYKQCNYVISLKYCLEHIIRNVNNTFKISDPMRPALRLHIQNLHQSTTIHEFHKATTDLFGFHSPSNSLLGFEIANYLLRIHPIHWTVFGNRESIPEESWIDIYCSLIYVPCHWH